MQEEAHRSELAVSKARVDVAGLGELQSDIICSEKLIIDFEKLSSLKSELKISKQNADVFQTNLDIAKSDAFSIAGGGDTLSAIDQFGVKNKISYIMIGNSKLISLFSYEKTS